MSCPYFGPAVPPHCEFLFSTTTGYPHLVPANVSQLPSVRRHRLCLTCKNSNLWITPLRTSLPVTSYTCKVAYGSYGSGNGDIETCTLFLCHRIHILVTNAVNAVSNSCVTDAIKTHAFQSLALRICNFPFKKNIIEEIQTIW